MNGLSRGMQQRLAVARVLLHDAKVLLMDEPASGLDPRARIAMRELLEELRRTGKTIVISNRSCTSSPKEAVNLKTAFMRLTKGFVQ